MLGADKFVIARQLGGATTRITDFSTTTANEKIDLSAFTNITSFTSLQRTNVNGNTEITLNNVGASQKLILEGVVSSSLTADDFIIGSYDISQNIQVNTALLIRLSHLQNLSMATFFIWALSATPRTNI
jgi:hypothetical protein